MVEGYEKTRGLILENHSPFQRFPFVRGSIVRQIFKDEPLGKFDITMLW